MSKDQIIRNLRRITNLKSILYCFVFILSLVLILMIIDCYIRKDWDYIIFPIIYLVVIFGTIKNIKKIKW